ncbi:IS21 family transposase [Cystobacter fuscus]
MDRKTARKYVKEGKFPSELEQERTWRTREDPFEEQWEGLAERLKEAPELEAKTLFEELCAREPGRYKPGQLRTLQRRVRQWRAQQGPEKQVFFAQEHRPGEAMQTDFTWANELEVTVEASPSRTCCVTRCCRTPTGNGRRCATRSPWRPSSASAGGRLPAGKVPRYHQTDNSTSATHDLRNGKRDSTPSTRCSRSTWAWSRARLKWKKEQNGDVEALNGALKRRLLQHLLMRGSRDFQSAVEYESWVQGVLEKANRLRGAKVEEELAAMRALSVQRLVEYSELEVVVTAWSTIRVQHNTYSVPSRLVGQRVRVRVRRQAGGAARGKPQLVVDRLVGRNGHRINYRHIIWSLVQKPGAFAQYRYREDLFPSLVFRRAYDELQRVHAGRAADVEYLRILHTAASTLEAQVEQVLARLLAEGGLRGAEQVKALVAPARPRCPSWSSPRWT